MDITHEAGSSAGRFTTADGESELTYRHSGEGRVDFDHTYVPDKFRGKGIAAALVASAVDWAREQGLKVVPQCSYVAAEFRRKPEYRDIAAD